LRAPIFVRGIRLGEVESVLLDEDGARIVGFDVYCGDGANRFLPFATARLTASGLEVESTLTLLDRAGLDFYRRRGRTLGSLPELADAVVGPEGTLIVPLQARC
jgi:hypothetical protein